MAEKKIGSVLLDEVEIYIYESFVEIVLPHGRYDIVCSRDEAERVFTEVLRILRPVPTHEEHTRAVLREMEDG